jgi:hypothetical protein
MIAFPEIPVIVACKGVAVSRPRPIARNAEGAAQVMPAVAHLTS